MKATLVPRPRLAKAREQSRSDIAAAMAIGRGIGSHQSKESLAKIESDLSQSGWVRADAVAEQFAAAGPPEAFLYRLNRARQQLGADVVSGHFRREGKFVDEYASEPWFLTTAFASTLSAHFPDREDFLHLCWISPEGAQAWLRKRATIYRKAGLRRSPGRRKGQGSYAKADAPIVEEMLEHVRKGSSIHRAALDFASKARRRGTIESVVSRLERRFRETYEEVDRQWLPKNSNSIELKSKDTR